MLGALDPDAPRRVMENYADLAPGFGRYVIESPFGEIYADPALDQRTRRLAAVAALTAVGDVEIPLAAHVRYALAAGATREEIVATVVQTSVYAGFPAVGQGARNRAGDVWKD